MTNLLFRYKELTLTYLCEENKVFYLCRIIKDSGNNYLILINPLLNSGYSITSPFLIIVNPHLFWHFQLFGSYAFQAVLNAVPSVDTFFLLSGCLLTYLTLKELDKTKGRLNWIMYYIHRYIRSFFVAFLGKYSHGYTKLLRSFQFKFSFQINL